MLELKGISGVSAWHVYNKVAFNLIFLREHRHDSIPIEVVKSLLGLPKNEQLDVINNVVKAEIATPRKVIEGFKVASVEDKKAMLLEALTVTALSDNDYKRLLVVHKNKYGVRYRADSIEDIPIDKVAPMIMDTLIACASMDCDLSMVKEDELSLTKKGRIDVDEEITDMLSRNMDADTGNVFSIAIKKVLNQWQKLKQNSSSPQK